MIEGAPRPPAAVNEPVLSYAPATPERAELQATLARMSGETIELPLHIDGRAVTTGQLVDVRAPHAHGKLLARAHQGGAAETRRAIDAARAAHPAWSRLPFRERAAVFLRAAELLAGPWRARLNTSTMLGQSKTPHQAEIDAACELIDFFRWNVELARRIHDEQPLSAGGAWNVMDVRPLEGFVLAVTPFNFTSIAGNLPTAPALMGNTVVWKPAATAAYSNHFVMELLVAAGLPPGVVNLVQGDPAEVVGAAVADPHLAGIHFTGSTAVFQHLWRATAERIASYRSYPRLVGETGGKDFIFAHASADLEALAVACVRGAFEFQGQKCSAASRLYVPRSIWPALRERLVALTAELRTGDPTDFRHFLGAVIDRRAFDKHAGYLALARADAACTVLTGGTCDDGEGFFVQPTIVETTDPRHRLMTEEIFGPVLTAWVYDDARHDEALALCDASTPYALTGAFFAQDRAAIAHAMGALRFSAGNFYVNDKPTGAVVAQQPFGGGRASGTNDKAGSALNLWRWVSPRIVKETLVPPREVTYPFLREK